MSLTSTNPTTGEPVERFALHSQEEVHRRLQGAAQAAARWRQASVGERAAYLERLADALEAERPALARLITREMGKPLRPAEAEVSKCANACRHYASNAGPLLAPEAIDGDDQGVMFQPLGVVLAVMPWNFPFWQVIRFAAPALVAGNVVLLKHASNVPACALALERLFAGAGGPPALFQTLLVGSDRVEGLIADDRVAAVTVTGSEAAGRAVASAAGRHIKKSVLELGGSDAFIVLESADLAAAVAAGVKARCLNNGQSCIAAKRFVVAAPIYDRFRAAFVSAMQAQRLGDPLDDATDLGPLATAAIRDGLDDQVRRTVAAGARLLCGGRAPARPGFFYEPTVLEEIPPGSPGHAEELFGPVACLFRAQDADHAVAIANDTRFGLGASVWTQDRAQADQMAAALDAGSVFVNDIVASDPRFPFGGVKRSGYGRELGVYGVREFANVKTVRITL